MEPTPANLRAPGALASLVAVNITPVAGILFLGWQPGAVLIGYFVDTFVGFGVVVLLVMVHVTGDGEKGPIVGWRRWTKALLGLAVLGAIMAFPLAFPIFVLYADDAQTHSLLRNTDFLLALAVQVLMSWLAAARMHRVLQATHDDEKILAGRTLFLAARWLAMFFALFAGAASFLGPRIGGFVLVAVYAGASIYFELDPGRAAQWLRGKNAKPIEFQGDLTTRVARRQRRG